jgi:hypothetical protein
MDDLSTKINIYGDEFTAAMKIAKEFENGENGEYYKAKMCLKQTGNTCPAEKTLRKHYDVISPYITNTYEEVLEHSEKKLCVLPLNHGGKCCSTVKMFLKNPITDKLVEKVEKSICTTPGADDYVFKNRGSRLFPIAVSSQQEKTIRDKNKKLKCAIPLKEKTTPFMMATAYLDYITYINSIDGINEYILEKSPHYQMCKTMFAEHKEHLQNFYSEYKRSVFDIDGFVVCAIMGKKVEICDVADVDRDNRTDIRQTDIQMGHIKSRCNECFTVYGKNIIMMSRRGNLLIGEHSFIEDIWLNEVQSIISHQKSSIKQQIKNEDKLSIALARIAELEAKLLNQ